MKYFYLTEHLYAEDEMELAIEDFMKHYACTYEQAKETVMKEDLWWRTPPFFNNYPIRAEKEYPNYKLEPSISICVYDMQDRNGWQSADYYFDDNTLWFSGAWQNVPPMKSDFIPTEKEASDWASKYVDLWID